MNEYFIIAISQFLFSLFRTLNTRYVSKDKIMASIITSAFVKILWLISTYYGLKGLQKGDIISAAIYVIFGIIGDRLAFTFKNK